MERISVIIPYNRDRGYLQQAIDSVHAQTVPVKLILSKSDGTCAENLVNGLEQVETEFYSVLAEDDYLHPQFAEKYIDRACFLSMQSIKFSLLYGDAYRIKGKDRQLYRGAYHGFDDLLKSTLIHGGAVLYRADDVRKVGGYDQDLKLAEEYDLHLKMSKAGLNFAYVNHPLYFYRIHSENKSKITNKNRAERQRLVNEIRDRYR